MSTAPLDITKATYCSDMVRMDLTACGEVNISNVPVSTASLSPSSVIVLDRGTDVYLWRGRDVVDAASPQLAAARHLCRDLLASRTAAFPAPRMSEYAQTDSMVRFFLVHLDVVDVGVSWRLHRRPSARPAQNPVKSKTSSHYFL